MQGRQNHRCPAALGAQASAVLAGTWPKVSSRRVAEDEATKEWSC